MESTESSVDLELIAALVDGTLADADRARAMKLLANSDAALEIFAHAIRERSMANAGKVAPISTARSWHQWKVLVPVMVAAGLAIVIVPKMTSRGTTAVLANRYAMELSRDSHFANGLPNGWEERGWTVTRGDGQNREGAGTNPVGGPGEARFAFRLGVRMVDLQVALQRGDTALAGRLTGEIVQTLHSVAFTDAIAAEYESLRLQLASNPLAQSIARASEREGELQALLGSTSLNFGRWASAAELAARTHDASFFESAHGTRYIRAASAAGILSREDLAALDQIDERLRGGATGAGLDDVRTILQRVIQRRGG